MSDARVLIVAETPSLARSLSYLLEAAGIATDTVPTLEPVAQSASAGPARPADLIIAASNGPYCVTARRWSPAEYPGTQLIVVGSRDPSIASVPKIHRVGLPLRPAALLDLVHEYLGASPPPSGASL